jgi:hypothetical protein
MSGLARQGSPSCWASMVFQEAGRRVVCLQGEQDRKTRVVKMVFSVPVNYAMRFSGPVTSLTARRLRYGA